MSSELDVVFAVFAVDGVADETTAEEDVVMLTRVVDAALADDDWEPFAEASSLAETDGEAEVAAASLLDGVGAGDVADAAELVVEGLESLLGWSSSTADTRV